MDTDAITLLCAGALAFSVINDVLLDGTDLGVGVLLGLTRRSDHRRAMAVSILPIWDTNETWLVLGGGGLLALFPQAYAILLPALYLPFILMFLALILRAMALEFRDHAASARMKRLVDAGLLCASLLTGMAQGWCSVRWCRAFRTLAGNTAALVGNGSVRSRCFAVCCWCAVIRGWVPAGCIGAPSMNCSSARHVRRGCWRRSRSGC